jgi:D-alanyl-D-alanine carboxypeptidase/D-alanyl-D-alanine-endopeptidase (penicillin-binding protein 4)
MSWLLGRRLLVGGLVAPLVASTVIALAPPAQAATGLSVLQHDVLAALGGSTAAHVALRADVGGLGQVWLAPASLQAPASNEKLLVAEAALQQLGPDYRFRTSVYATGPVVDHVLGGDLVLICSGDPTLVFADLTGLARTLAGAGIHSVAGRLLVDDGLFAPRAPAPGWKPGFVPYEVGPVSTFAVDQNEYRTDATFVTHPDVANAALWRTGLSDAGVHVDGPTWLVGGLHVDGLTPLVVHDSAPLSSIVATMLTYSDNYFAEALLDAIGARLTGLGSRLSGISALRLESTRLRSAIGATYDGSGLSYWDTESPNTLVRWLEASARSSTGATLRSGLAVSCRTGTLVRRLCGAWLTGRVQAKTGTLTGIRTLSGYTTTRSGRAVTFSIMLSGIRDMTLAQQHIDAAVAVLARWAG